VVTAAFTARGVFPARWLLPYWVAQFAGAIGAALFLQAMYTHVSAGGNYPIAVPGGEWRSLVMETVLTAILASVILNTATGTAASGTTPPSRRRHCRAARPVSPARSPARR
jgi:aquaporin Z